MDPNTVQYMRTIRRFRISKAGHLCVTAYICRYRMILRDSRVCSIESKARAS